MARNCRFLPTEWACEGMRVEKIVRMIRRSGAVNISTK